MVCILTTDRLSIKELQNPEYSKILESLYLLHDALIQAVLEGNLPCVAHPASLMRQQLLATVLAAFAVVSNAAPDAAPLTPVGGVAPAPLDSGLSEYYYQVSSGAIVGVEVSGPFETSSSTTSAPFTRISPGQALFGTPIATCSSSTAGATEYTNVRAYETVNGCSSILQLHVFYFDPENLLSEFTWTPSIGWQNGSACTNCVQQAGFFGVNGSQVLYAYENSPAGTVRVGFISAGSPQTLSEAVQSPNAAWSLTTLPN